MSNHNNPDYYRWHPSAPECYKVAQEFPYNLGNALTYIWRAGKKPGNDAVKDLEKAVDHLRFEIERLRGLDHGRNKPYSAAVDGLRHAHGTFPAHDTGAESGCVHEPDGMIYTSYPPKYKCIKCKAWYPC